MIIINCKNKKLGRISSIISKILIYFNFINKKIKILLFNIKKIFLNKKKIMYSHSGFLGKIKKKKYILNELFLKKSIFKMLPKNFNRILLIKKIFFIK